METKKVLRLRTNQPTLPKQEPITIDSLHTNYPMHIEEPVTAPTNKNEGWKKHRQNKQNREIFTSTPVNTAFHTNNPFKRRRDRDDINKSDSNEEMLNKIFVNNKQNVERALNAQINLATRLRTDQSMSKQELVKKWRSQLQYLERNGFKRKLTNIVELILFTGDQEKALFSLVKQIILHEKYRIQYESFLEPLKRSKRDQLVYFLYHCNGDIATAQLMLDSFDAIPWIDHFRSEIQAMALQGWIIPSTYQKIVKIFKKTHQQQFFYDGSQSEDILGQRRQLMIQLECLHKIKQINTTEKNVLKQFQCLEELPEKINEIILDANNVLFINSSIRNDCIHGNRASAERKVIALSREFFVDIQKKQPLTFHVIFDQMHSQIDQSAMNLEGFQVTNIKETTFKSSDDYIASYMAEKQQEQSACILVVTSDQELTYRMINKQNDINVMKGKRYFSVLESIISKQKFNAITFGVIS